MADSGGSENRNLKKLKIFCYSTYVIIIIISYIIWIYFIYCIRNQTYPYSHNLYPEIEQEILRYTIITTYFLLLIILYINEEKVKSEEMNILYYPFAFSICFLLFVLQITLNFAYTFDIPEEYSHPYIYEHLKSAITLFIVDMIIKSLAIFSFLPLKKKIRIPKMR